MAKDQSANRTFEQTLDPINITADVNGGIVDRKDFESIDHVALIGLSADTLSGSVLIDVLLQHGDVANMSDAAVVTDANHVRGTMDDLATGRVARIDAPAEDETFHEIGYRGPKRYTRLVLDLTGTHTNGTPVALSCEKGHPRFRGGAGQQMGGAGTDFT